MDLWRELHERALNFKGENDNAFLLAFSKKIPRYTPGCSCREHWKLIIKQNPPKFGDQYFAWTVLCHNEINKKLGKPVYSVEEARKFYEKK